MSAISSSVSNQSESTSNISDRVSSSADSSREIATQIESIAKNTKEMSGKIGHSAEESGSVKHVVDEFTTDAAKNSDNIIQVKNAVTNLSAVAKELTGMVNQYKIVSKE